MLYYLGKGTEFKKEDCKEYKTIEGAMKAAAKDESFVVWDENGNIIGSLTDNVPEGALQTNPDGSVNTYDADGNKVGTVDAETVEKMTTFESDEDVAGQQEDESFVVWDENGNIIGSLTDNVPEGALQTNPDGSVNTYDADGNKVGTVDAETVEKMTTFESDEDVAGQQEDAEDGGTASNDAETTNPPSEPETGENGANTEPQEVEDEPEDKVITPQGKMKVTVICDGSLNIRRSAAWGNENICGRAIRGQSYYVKEIHVVDGKKMVRTIGDLYLSGESEHVQFEQL